MLVRGANGFRRDLGVAEKPSTTRYADDIAILSPKPDELQELMKGVEGLAEE